MIQGDLAGVAVVYIYVAIMLLVTEKALSKYPTVSRKILHDDFPNFRIVATGSSSLEISHRIKEALTGRKVFTLGNIGNPFSGSVIDIDKSDYVCLEVSSFQLEKIVWWLQVQLLVELRESQIQ